MFTVVKLQETFLPNFNFVSMEFRTSDDQRKIKKFKIVDSLNKTLSYADFLLNIEANHEFLEDFNDVLKRGLQSFSDSDMTPYFFETPPVTLDDMREKDFEFVLISAPEFVQATPQPEWVLFANGNKSYENHWTSSDWAAPNICQVINCMHFWQAQNLLQSHKK